jgi:TIR domain
MRVFISWSGDRSRKLAQAIRNWLPSTLQYVKPYFTPADIEKGSKWDNEISKELEKSNICIIALTRESLASQWIMFEAGAISRSVEKSRVYAILFDLEITDVQGPLERFQATKFSKDEIRQLLVTINSNAGEQALPQSVLDTVFNKWWPDLESDVQGILSATPSSAPAVRTERSLLEETLLLVRSVHQEQTEVRTSLLSQVTQLRRRPEDIKAELTERLAAVRDSLEKMSSPAPITDLTATINP